MTVTRFAPSPNGALHLGHAHSAIVGHDLATSRGGLFLLRIEDIDGSRARPELPALFRADLAWLGLDFTERLAQSTRLTTYAEAARRLRADGLLYPCSCNRADIEAAAERMGPEGPVYPGTCRKRPADRSRPIAWRLDIERALVGAGQLHWEDERHGVQIADPLAFGDVVLVRKDAPASYHLAVTIDDATDGVTLVTRGMDLFAATHIHRLLQALLDLPVPRWHHHSLLVDMSGRKLAKRRGSPSLTDRRLAGDDGRKLANALRAGVFPAGITLAST